MLSWFVGDLKERPHVGQEIVGAHSVDGDAHAVRVSPLLCETEVRLYSTERTA